jgi:hypothetical protein
VFEVGAAAGAMKVKKSKAMTEKEKFSSQQPGLVD